MDMNSEKRIKEVMNSLDGMHSAEAGPFLYSKIQSKINQPAGGYSGIKLVWLAAASFAILVVLNIGVIKFINNSKTDKAEYQSSSTGYNLINTNYISYN